MAILDTPVKPEDEIPVSEEAMYFYIARKKTLNIFHSPKKCFYWMITGFTIEVAIDGTTYADLIQSLKNEQEEYSQRDDLWHLIGKAIDILTSKPFYVD